MSDLALPQTYMITIDKEDGEIDLSEKVAVVDKQAKKEGRISNTPTTFTAEVDEDEALEVSLEAGDFLVDPDFLFLASSTPLKLIYDRFFGKITDDMYMEWTKEDTENDLYNIFVDAVPNFEFPRFALYDYDEEEYRCSLTSEEINILAICMLSTWLQRQITSIENTRQKYSGSDFKMTSQANHLTKLLELKKETDRQNLHMQRLYKRRKMVDLKGTIKSNWSTLMEKSTFDG